MAKANKKVCMLLMGELRYDGRVRKEAAALAQHGYAVTVITMPRAPEEVPGLGGVQVKEVILLTRKLAQRARGTAAKYAEYVLKAASRAVSTGAAVYHAHDLPTLLPAYLAARVRRGRLVYDAHELWTEQGSRTTDTAYWRKLERWLLKRVNAVVTVNEARAQIIRDEYGYGAFPVVLHNCPPLNGRGAGESKPLRQFVASYGRSESKVVLYQGSVSPDRGYETLIRAAQQMEADATVVILGYGSPPAYLDALKQLAADLGVQERALFHPPVPNDQIMNYTASADIGIVFYDGSSRNNLFCAPNKLYDYMMAGIPVIGSNLPGLCDPIETRQVGLTVDSDNPGAVVEAVNHLLRDDDLRRRLGANGRKLAETEFNWEHQSERLVTLYQRLIPSL